MLAKNFSLMPVTLSLKKQYAGSCFFCAGRNTKLFQIHYDIIRPVHLIIEAAIGGEKYVPGNAKGKTAALTRRS